MRVISLTTFAPVRKYFLCISLPLGILLCFANGGSKHHSVATTQQITGECSVISISYPHTEIELPHSILSLGNNSRTLNLHDFVNAAQVSDSGVCKGFQIINEILIASPHKAYLLHIYPSHNFW